MPFPNPPYDGTCLCGAVRVHVSAPPLLTFACHCSDCQKLCASTYSLTTMFPRDSFTCTGELIKGGLGKPGRAHYFCKSCKCFVFSLIGDPAQRANLRTTILNDAASFAPFVELMTDEKMPWVNLQTAHSYRKFPQTQEELQSLMNAYCDR